MASSWSDLKIQLMASGENTTTWGNVTNLNWTNVQSMICGTDSVTFASANETLTLTNTTGPQTARFARLELTGTTGGSSRDLIVPTVEKTYIIYNSCADTVRVKTAAGTGVNVPAGKSTSVVVDGTNVVAAEDYFPNVTTNTLTASNGTFGTPLGITSGGTGSNTAAGALAALFPVGVILDYGGTSAPTGWLLAYGQNVSRSTYSALFAVFGTTYGAGDGSTTFGLPDYRGRVGAGKDDMGGVAASRITSAGSGVDGATLGASGGAQSTTLVVSNLPSHTHALTDGGHTHTANAHNHGVTDPTHSHTYSAEIVTAGSNNRQLTAGSPNYHVDLSGSTDAASTGISINNATVTLQTAVTGITLANTGSGSAFATLPPTIIVNKIIFAGV